MFCSRRGSQDVEVQLQIEVDNQPERFNLSASLSAILGLKQATRASVLHTLWAYIKSHRLQVLQCLCTACLLGLQQLLTELHVSVADSEPSSCQRES